MSRARQQPAAIAALVEHGTVEKAAAALRVRASTLQAWIEDPEFIGAVRAARAAAFDAQFVRLTGRVGEAIDTLLAIMRDGAGKDCIAKLRAAARVIELGRHTIDRDNLWRRVEALERDAAVRKAGRH